MLSIMTIVFALVLIIIRCSMTYGKKDIQRQNRAFLNMLNWVIFFCLQDCVWCMIDMGLLKSDMLFFISSSVFHMSTVLTTYFWLRYVLSFLGDEVVHTKLYLRLDYFFILFEAVLVISNFFSPVLFTVENGEYVVQRFRPLTFYNQYSGFVIIAVLMVIFSIKKRGDKYISRRYRSVFIFTLAPLVVGVFQYLFPHEPYYSVGYFLGCFVVYVFIVAKDEAALARTSVLTAVADTFFSMLLLDLDSGVVEPFLESDKIRSVGDCFAADKNSNIQAYLNSIFEKLVCEEHEEAVREFIDLSTLESRLSGRKSVACEFVGTDYGWMRLSFVVVERTDDKLHKVMYTSKIIDAEKRSQNNLLFLSKSDELTGLYNRRAFESGVMNNPDIMEDEDLVYISMDVNGLKIVNDTMGHSAGDELLVGAAGCIKKVFSHHGKIFRIGGDEFIAIIYVSAEELADLMTEFENTVRSWSGETVSKLTVSSGYVRRDEVTDGSIVQMSLMADKRMYESKNRFYRRNGSVHRGQLDACLALCETYVMILKANLTDDSFSIVRYQFENQTTPPGTLSQWISDFGRSGVIHPDDLEGYFSRTNPTYMSDFFRRRKETLNVFYRRRDKDGYANAFMEITPAADYSDDNQSLYVFIKDIEIEMK